VQGSRPIWNNNHATRPRALANRIKAGLIEEMLDDVMDAMDADDLEEEADEEVEKVLAEITSGTGDTAHVR